MTHQILLRAPRALRALGVPLAAGLTCATITGGCASTNPVSEGPHTAGAPSTLPSAAGELPRSFSRAGRAFELAWVDDFTSNLGPATRGDWTFDTNEAWLHPSNVKIEDEALALWLTPRGDVSVDSDRRYLGAEYDRSGAQLYGLFLTRFRPAAPPGVIASFFTAFYEFNADYSQLLETAEIDIEFVGTTRAVQFALHWVDAGGTKRDVSHEVPLDFDAGEDFHVWEIEWLEDSIAFFVDGRELHRFTEEEPVREQRIAQEVKANIWISSSTPWAGEFSDGSLPIASRYDWIATYTLAQ